MEEHGNAVYLNLFCEISPQSVNHIMRVCTEIVVNNKPDTLYFSFSSPGGSVSAGISLYNFLKALPVKVVMHNTGSIDSIATIVFLAGDERIASPHSSFLFHGVKTTFPSGNGLTLAHLKEVTSCLTRDEEKIAGIISSNTKLSTRNIRNLFKQGESKDTSFALNKGFIHRVEQLNIPRGAKIATLSFT